MKKFDYILIVAAMAIALGLLLSLNIFSKKGEVAVVKVSGKIIGEYEINENKEITIEGKDQRTNKLIMNHGQVWIGEADCRDQICVKHKAISQVGESIICLPNEVVIEIKEQGVQEGIDSYAK